LCRTIPLSGKAELLKMLGPPLNLTMAEVARREGVTSLSDIELGEYCRHKGLYPEQIAPWRQAFLSGMAPQKTPPKVDREQSRQDKKRIKQLERELRRKDKALAETAALPLLRKKLND